MENRFPGNELQCKTLSNCKPCLHVHQVSVHWPSRDQHTALAREKGPPLPHTQHEAALRCNTQATTTWLLLFSCLAIFCLMWPFLLLCSYDQMHSLRAKAR